MGESAATSLQNAHQGQTTAIDVLFPNVLEKVFSYLDLKDVIAASRVCQLWKEVVNDGPLMGAHELTITSNQDVGELATILNSLPMLRNIVVRCQFIDTTDALLQTVAKHCRDIRYLHFDKETYVHLHRLQHILKKFAGVQSLRVPLCENANQILEFVSSNSNLKAFGFAETTRFDLPSVHLGTLADGCPGLAHLDIRHGDYTVQDFIYLIRQKKQQLKSLLFNSKHFVRGTVVPLRECKNLEHIACMFLSNYYPVKAFVDEIVSLLRLKRLGLGFCDGIGIGANDLTKLCKCDWSSKLTGLDCNSMKITKSLARAIVSCFPNIRTLCVEKCLQSEPSVLREFLKFNQLQHLELGQWKFSQKWFEKLLLCKRIKHLCLEECFGLKDKYALTLVQNLNLTHLEIKRCCLLTDKFIKLFPHSRTLKELHLYSCYFSKHSLENLRRRITSTLVIEDCWRFLEIVLPTM